MINNQTQYEVSKLQAARLTQALAHAANDLGSGTPKENILKKAQYEGIKSLLDGVNEEIQEYESGQK